MNEQELIAAVQAAKDKDELEKLVLEELGISLDKRRGLETLRADILTGLGVGSDSQQQEQEEQGTEQQEPQAGLQEQQGQGDIAPAAQQQEVAPSAVSVDDIPTSLHVGLDLADPQLPELEGDEGLEQELEMPAPTNRLLRNIENGREFIWTPELAKLSHMEEV